ncbi:DUF5819 family protein [Streptomyces sp. TRM70308]|uniref:DUF5819 family protein n=1 Tax=Streptomyces sp. TRM70308 TaxID=3131932 RepID=UPI003CFE6CE8
MGVLTAGHLGAVFFHLAPDNAVTEAHGEAIDDWIYPELDQNWKLFAPEPLYRTERVHARARVRDDDGTLTTTDWHDLSAPDIAATRGHLLPSHTRNHLRKGWDAFTGSHDDAYRPVGPRGHLMRAYLERVAVRRLAEMTGTDAGAVEQLQLREAVTPVPDPPWRPGARAPGTRYTELPWWQVRSEEPEGGRP